jgi:Fe-S cluster biogenesis protein NfuA
MFIQTEETRDPSTLKFLPGREVLADGSLNFNAPEDARNSPLAQRLFDIGAVKVAFGHDHITLTKDKGTQWKTLKPAILGAIMDHFTSNEPVVTTGPSKATAEQTAEQPALVMDGEVAEQIIELLETRIRPVAKDQDGDVQMVGFNPKTGRVHLELTGGAKRLLGGIQTMLRHYVPEVAEVVDNSDWTPKPGLDSDEGRAVQAVLDNEINPGVAMHGGRIRLIDVLDHTAYIRLEGGCHGCGAADVTLKQGVEVAIMEGVPTIVAVLDTTDHAEGKNPYYQAH